MMMQGAGTVTMTRPTPQARTSSEIVDRDSRLQPRPPLLGQEGTASTPGEGTQWVRAAAQVGPLPSLNGYKCMAEVEQGGVSCL
jgi:hypothetical protein